MVEQGLAEKIQFIDSTGTEIQSLFGGYANAYFIPDESNRREGSIGNNGKPLEISDGPVENRAGITCKPETLEILKIMGSYDSNAGTITFTKYLPEHQELNGQFTPSHRFHFENFKVGGFTLTSSIDNSVQIAFSPIQAKTGQVQEQTVSVGTQDCSPLQWTDTVVKINGSQFGVTESVNTSLDRNIQPEYGLGQGREPAEISEGQFDIEPSFVVKVEDAEPWKQVLDDTTFPLQIQDKRSPISEISFDFGDGNGELVITDGKAEINEFEMEEEKDTRTVELNFEGVDIEVRNL